MDGHLDEDITAAVTQALDAEVNALLTQTLAERTEWDEPPELYLILENNAGEMYLETVLSAGWEVWDIIPDPVLVLLKLSEALADDSLMAVWPEQLSLVPAEGFCGMAFRVEAWGVKYGKDSDPEVQERLRRASAEHDLHLQPERVEMRQVMAYMRNGSVYWVQQERDGEPIAIEGAEAAEGRVPDALKGITAGLHRVARKQAT